MHVYPEFFARFYDIIYKKIRSDVDQQYFLNKINKTKGKSLEIGVGTGRFFIEALKNGADIYGIDISTSMIHVLKSKLKSSEHYRIKIADITKYTANEKYELIIAPFRVFSHLLSTADQINALNNINAMLTTGGKLIFDLFVPNLEMLQNGLNEKTDFEDTLEDGLHLKRIVSMQADLINQLSEVEFRFEWTENGCKNIETWKTRLRYYFRYELQYLIEKSNLELVNIYGDYSENQLNTQSKDFVVVCKKGK